MTVCAKFSFVMNVYSVEKGNSVLATSHVNDYECKILCRYCYVDKFTAVEKGNSVWLLILM